jgi:anti-sigma regulatory factor (Ser/Thr protein kinase)
MGGFEVTIKRLILIRELFTIDSLGRVRDLVRRAAALVGLSRSRTDNLVLAVSEAATNAIVHGGGGGELELIQNNGSSLTARITDHGAGIHALSNPPRRPGPDAISGRGHWFMYEHCDRVSVASNQSGTTVELEMALV